MLVSVIIVSRDRQASLGLALTSLTYQTHAPFEVIVVGDDAAERAVSASGLADRIVFVPFGPANVAAARNAGLAQALGDVVAFLDDDAVAEPCWLEHLIGPFADPTVAASGGFVRARNGISYQWRGETLTPLARHTPIDIRGTDTLVRGWQNGSAFEIMGTNCAYRREVLCGLGGFDPVFRYYLDESDVNLRLALAGFRTAIVPLAQVHHKLAPSNRRRKDRVPTSLQDAGRSLRAFLIRHAPDKDHAPAIARHRQDHRQRLVKLMVAGLLLPGQVQGLLAGFDRAVADPPADPVTLPPIQPERSRACLFRATAGQGIAATLVAKGRSDAARRAAADRAAQGQIVTLFELSPTTLYHQVSFQPEGYWLHRGGVFGRSERTGKLVQLSSRLGRVRAEIAKRRGQRLFSDPETVFE